MMRWIEDRGDIEFYDNGKGKRFQKITFLNTVSVSWIFVRFWKHLHM